MPSTILQGLPAVGADCRTILPTKTAKGAFVGVNIWGHLFVAYGKSLGVCFIDLIEAGRRSLILGFLIIQNPGRMHNEANPRGHSPDIGGQFLV